MRRHHRRFSRDGEMCSYDDDGLFIKCILETSLFSSTHTFTASAVFPGKGVVL